MGSSSWISVHDLMPHELSARIFRFENADLAEANQCSTDDDKQWMHPTIDHIMLVSPGQALCDELRERLQPVPLQKKRLQIRHLHSYISNLVRAVHRRKSCFNECLSKRNESYW